MIQILSRKVFDNVIITVLTKAFGNYKDTKQQTAKGDIQRLLDAGIRVVAYPGLHQRFAVIDQRIVWYGSASLLGFADKAENMMRLDGEDIAMALLKQYHELYRKQANDSEELLKR